MFENIRKLNSVLKGLRQKRVVLYAEKSFETYCAVFGIILSENIWIPVNPETPVSRTIDMLETACPDMIIAETPLNEKVKQYVENSEIPCIRLDEILSGFEEVDLVEGEFPEDDIAYIMFTSGSTGVPKGVPMTHKNYTNFLFKLLDILPLGNREVFADLHDLGFDISIVYLFLSVMTKGAIVPVKTAGERYMPLDNIIQNKVTFLATVPSTISLIKMLRPDEHVKTDIKIAFLCGEPFSHDILKYCDEQMKIPDIFNFYGLTETGVENFYHHCNRANDLLYSKHGFIPIGKPINGNNVRITPDGELMLCGCQITPGYLGGKESDRFEIIDETRWFYTGDIVVNDSEVYWCKGRKDSQVKLSGHRVELMDIEANVRRIQNVNEAVCYVNNAEINPTLWCVIESHEPVDENMFRETLKKSLPPYMIPHRIKTLTSFPRNRSGKIDRIRIKQELNLDL